ncbi:MAG: hypothetical protein ACOX9C_03030 [Kiritimatiellia bacterium]|jgi:hypothetical protein
MQPNSEKIVVSTPSNPLFKGWYADPRIRVYGSTFWIFPTISGPFDEQPGFDAFSSPDFRSLVPFPDGTPWRDFTGAQQRGVRARDGRLVRLPSSPSRPEPVSEPSCSMP